MKGTVSHDWQEETIEAKTRWFRSLTLEERMEMLCEFTDLALEINPAIVDKRDAESTSRTVRVVKLPGKR